MEWYDPEKYLAKNPSRRLSLSQTLSMRRLRLTRLKRVFLQANGYVEPQSTTCLNRPQRNRVGLRYRDPMTTPEKGEPPAATGGPN